MSWKTLRLQLFNLINDNKVALGVQEVKNTAGMNFNGYPSISISPVGSPNDYQTTTENQRIYSFSVRIFNETAHAGLDGSIQVLEGMVDNVIDLIDKDSISGSVIGINMPTGKTFINTRATSGLWFKSENERLVYVELEVKIVIDVDLTI